MRICRIKIANYRGLHDFEVGLGAHGVFVGPNDSGKTSVLRALDLLLGSTLQSVYAQISPRDFTDPQKVIEIETDLLPADLDELTAFPDEVDLSAGTPTITYRVEIECLDESTGELNVRRWFPSSGHDRSASRDQVEAIGWSYYPASRSLGQDLTTGRRGALRHLLNNLELAETRSLEAAFRMVQDAVESHEDLESFRSAMGRALDQTLPSGGPTRVDLLLRGDLEGELFGSLDVALRRGRRAAPALLNEQSDGLRALTAIAIYSMDAADNGITAIDEPELHLHPASQRAIGGLLLRQTAGQTLVATHSSGVVAEADPSHVVAFSTGAQPRTLPSTAKASRPDFVARWWTTGLVELLTAQRVGMVEGPADRILVEQVAQAHGLTLGRAGVALLDLEGAPNFRHALAVLGPDGFDVDYRALGDEDTRSAWAKQVGESDPQALEARGFVFSAADLEDEYVRSLGYRRVVRLLVQSGYVSTAQIKAVARVGSLTALTQADVVGVCRKYKVEAAAAITQHATPPELRCVASVSRFVRDLCA